MINRKKDIKIKSAEQFENIMKERQDNIKHRKVNPDMLERDTQEAQHLECANTLLKLISCIKLDPIIKKVMTLRLLGPIISKRERTYLSIGLELGISEQEVKQIDMAGLEVVDGYLQRFSTSEFIDKFNQEKQFNRTIQKG